MKPRQRVPESSEFVVIREPELLRIVPLDRVTIWRYEQSGRFPKRIKLGGRAIGWKLADVLAWIDSCQGRSISPDVAPRSEKRAAS